MFKIVALIFVIILVQNFSACPKVFAQDKATLKVSAFEYYPAIFKDRDGKIRGFYVDALADIAEKENFKIEYIYGTWNESIENLSSGEIDLLLNVPFSKERLTTMDFSTFPLLTVWGELFTYHSSNIESIKKLQNKKIGILKGDPLSESLMALLEKFAIKVTFINMKNHDEMFKAISEKKIDAGLSDNTFGSVKQYEYGITSTGIVFNPYNVFFATKKNNNNILLKKLDSYLEKWKNAETSPLTKAKQQWTTLAEKKYSTLPHWMMTWVPVSLSTILLLFVLIYLLRKKLIQLSAKHEAILAAIPDIIMEANEKVVYTWSNKAGYEFFGNDVIGKAASSYFAAGQDPSYLKLQPLFSSNTDLVYVESVQRRKDNENRLLAFICKAIKDKNGKILSIIATARDITDKVKIEEEKKQMELQLFQSSKLASIGTLAAGIAHEINNPLYFAIGYEEILESSINKCMECLEAKEVIVKLKDSLIRIKNIVSRLKIFAKNQDDVLEICDLNEVINKALSMIENIYGNENITIKSELCNKPLFVNINEIKLEQVLVNVISNAKDALETKINNKTIFVKSEILANKAKISITDLGIGICEENIKRIFDPFFTTKEVGKGTGLGLSISNTIIGNFGGKIDIKSKPNQGTTVTITLPLTNKEEIKINNRNKKNDFKTLRGEALVVDDEEEGIYFTSRYLREFGIKTNSAKSGEEGIEKFKTQHFDYLITDMKMPGGMNGLELIKKCLEINKKTKFIILSGAEIESYSTETDLFLRENNVGFINKPASKESIYNALTSI